MPFSRIAERKIVEAQKKGLFSDLEGRGKPLKQEEISVPEDLRLAYRMLKTAGYIPEELALKKEIHNTQELLKSTEEVKDKYKLLTKLNLMIRRFNLKHTSRISQEIPEIYLSKISTYLENKQS